ncbi:unnamed protein product [Effrenium voratum]|nr:unnamed protein product [Effrenium voratum]
MVCRRDVKQASRAAAATFAIQRRGSRSPREKQKQCILSGLKALGAPAVVAILVSLLFAKPLVFTPLLDHVELFAGQMSVSIGEMEENRCAVALDLEMGKSGEMGEDAYNMLHPIGFAHSLFQVARRSNTWNSLPRGTCLLSTVTANHVRWSSITRTPRALTG